MSRRWHNILKSDTICRSLAVGRFPAASREFILSQQAKSHSYHSNIKSWRHLFEDIASQRYFFSKGRYIAYPQLDSFIAEQFESAACPRLHEGNLISWDCHLTFMRNNNTPEVLVYNLHDPAQAMRFPIPNREMIGAYAIHDELLTVLTGMG